MTTPIRAGAKIRASELNAARPSVGFCDTDQSKAANTTLAAITGVACPLEADGIYAVDAYVAYNANATGDLKLALAGPAGSTGHWGIYAMAAAATGTAGDLNALRADVGSTLVAGGSGTSPAGAHICIPRGIIEVGATAGDLVLQFAQNVSNATATVIKAGTWLRAWRIA